MKRIYLYSITRIAKGIVPIVQSSYMTTIHHQPANYHGYINQTYFTNPCLHISMKFWSSLENNIFPNLDCVEISQQFCYLLGWKSVFVRSTRCLPMHPQHGRHDGPSAWMFPGSRWAMTKRLSESYHIYTGLLHDRILILAYGKNKSNKFLLNGKPSLFFGFFRKNLQATHCLVIEIQYLCFAPWWWVRSLPRPWQSPSNPPKHWLLTLLSRPVNGWKHYTGFNLRIIKNGRVLK